MSQVRHDKETFYSSPQIGAGAGKRNYTGVACRVHDKAKGDALVYSADDGSASYEYRTLDELRSITKQLNTGNVPVKVQHGTVAGYGDQNVGRVTSAKIQDGLCKVTFSFDASVSDPGQLVRDFPELSLGSLVAIRPDGHQVNTRVTELSICRRARCGAVCKINMDGTRTDCACESCTNTAKAVADALYLAELDREAEAAVAADLADRTDAPKCSHDRTDANRPQCEHCGKFQSDPDDDEDEDDDEEDSDDDLDSDMSLDRADSGDGLTLMERATRRLKLRSATQWMTTPKK